MFLNTSKTDQFHQGCPIVIGCTGTSICRACKAWHLLQQHQQMGSSPEAPFFKLQNRAPGSCDFSEPYKTCCYLSRTRSFEVLWSQLAYKGSHFSSESLALPVADQTLRMLEQPGISSVHKARSISMCRASCLHGS